MEIMTRNPKEIFFVFLKGYLLTVLLLDSICSIFIGTADEVYIFHCETIVPTALVFVYEM